MEKDRWFDLLNDDLDIELEDVLSSLDLEDEAAGPEGEE